MVLNPKVGRKSTVMNENREQDKIKPVSSLVRLILYAPQNIKNKASGSAYQKKKLFPIV
jgi:hypothetical protein